MTVTTSIDTANFSENPKIALSNVNSWLVVGWLGYWYQRADERHGNHPPR